MLAKIVKKVCGKLPIGVPLLFIVKIIYGKYTLDTRWGVLLYCSTGANPFSHP